MRIIWKKFDDEKPDDCRRIIVYNQDEDRMSTQVHADEWTATDYTHWAYVNLPEEEDESKS